MLNRVAASKDVYVVITLYRSYKKSIKHIYLYILIVI